MKIDGTRVLVLGGAGLVGTAVCRELLTRGPAEIIIHSRRAGKADAARQELFPEAGTVRLDVASGDMFGLVGSPTRWEHLRAQLASLKDLRIEDFLLHRLLIDSAPDNPRARENGRRFPD